MMNDAKRRGSIKCECNNEFYFESFNKEIPCMACGKKHPNNGELIPEEPPTEEGDPDGTAD